jgi:succinate-semialdehyde dehydrogenase/glutarate-semialdehyde dehydrogenase
MKIYMEGLKYWDPMESDTILWPLANAQFAKDVDAQVQKTIEQWATLITWWKILWETGQFYAPTILWDVTKGMLSYDEEVFWPVASIIKSPSIEESIKIANDSQFWLSAVVYWDNPQQCREVAEQLEWGMIFINAPAGSQAHLPFGWVKNSWYGKENGPEWLRSFTNKKAIVY